MSSNSPRLSREDVRSVAVYQKVILVCILAYLGAFVASLAMPPALRIFMGLGMMGVGIVSAVFVFQLAVKVYNVGLGVFFGIVTFIPCIGLIMLLVINGKATNVLKAHGYRVGLLGADLSSAPARPKARRRAPGDARITRQPDAEEDEDEG
jgi:hypothetical protein